MEFELIEEKINLSIKSFMEKEKYLLEKNLNERNITARLILYIQNNFNDYDVDCEYNRNLSENKDVFMLKAEYDRIKNDSNVSANPDIIVHKRGTKNNLLILEVKKSRASAKSINFDKLKLRKYTSTLGYKFGLFLKISTGNLNSQVEKLWFKDGEVILNEN